MEVIRGRQSSFIDALALAEKLATYQQIHIDIGTGDGRYVQHIAQSHPDHFVIGIDACRENLHQISRRAPDNALFIIANALALPSELNALAMHITVNFPWGSLLHGLLAGDVALLQGMMRIGKSPAALEIRLNGGALAEAGWPLEDGAHCVQQMLTAHGFRLRPPAVMQPEHLRVFPTTWSKRLAFGRDPRAMLLRGHTQ